MADAQLEESLAITSIVAKAESRLATQLRAVNQRLSVIRGGAKVEDANNPFAPALLCQAFRMAMREFDLNNQSRMIIYKLFDRYVISGLEPAYMEVNANLIQSGVLQKGSLRICATRWASAATGCEPARAAAPIR